MRRFYVLTLILSLVAASTYALLWYSSRSIGMRKLSTLLEEQAWKDADKETNALMLRLTRRDKIYLFYINPAWFQVSSTPCSDLIAINGLWELHSDRQKSLTVFMDKWESATAEIDWSKYSYLGDDSDSLRATQAFDELYINVRERDSATQQEISYPTYDWIIDGLADFEDPIFLLNGFTDRYRSCSPEE